MEKSGIRRGLFGFLLVLLFASMAGFASADVFVDNTDVNFSKGTLHLTNISGAGAEANVTLNFTTINTFRVYNKSGNFTSQIFDTGQIVATFDKISWKRVLANSSDVMGIVYDRGTDDMAAFLRNGSYVADITHGQFASDVDFTEDLQKYNIPSDFSYDDIIGFAIEEDVDDVAVFFRNGSFVLDLTVTNLSQQIDFDDSIRRFTLPAGFNISDAVGVEYGETSNDAAIFFRNGSYVSDPSHTTLDGDISFTNVHAYTIPSSLSYDDIIGFGNTHTQDDVGAFFRNKSFVTNTSQPNLDSDISFVNFNTATYPSYANLVTYTNITLQTRVSNDSITFTPWSRNYTNPNGSESIESNIGRYIQYKAVLETPYKYITPFLENVSINYSLDLTKPSVKDPSTTANSRNFVSPGFIFNASANATDANLLNVTCTLSGTTVGFFSVNGDIHVCNLTAPATEGDFVINITAIDKANNTNTTTINFTTKNATSADLTTYNIAVSGLNQSNKIVEVTATFNNKGSNIIYSPNIILSGFESNFAVPTTTWNKTCAANLTAGQSCNSTFNITIFGGTAAGGIEGYTILWKANWTDNSFTSNKLIESAPSIVTISSNPQITVTENMTATIGHNTSQTLNILLNSTGNADLQNAIIAFTPSTLMQSWITISPSSFSSITAGLNKSFNVTVVVPKYTSPGNYTGTLTISATSAESKSILLKIEIPEDSSWTSYPSNITAFKKTNSAGLLGAVYINNTGNIGHRFDFSAAGNLREDIWNDSNPTSQYVEAGRTELVNFNYKRALDISNTYTATLTITSFNKSTANYTYFSLRRDDNNPNLNITSPLNNSFVNNGTVKFSVTASDLNLSTIKFYINNTLVFDDINLTKTFNWNTTNGNYPDEDYTLKAIAYDSAGNSNSSYIDVTVNNTDSNPVLKANIPNIALNEGATTTINLSNYFKSIDGDALNYNSTIPDNVTVSINNTNTTVTLTAVADFFGIRYIVFYANDTSQNVTASNNITINVTNINDAPTTPNLLSPLNNSNATSAAGNALLGWNSSIDADNDAITYHIFISNDSNDIRFNATTTAASLQLTNLYANKTYYWKVFASDNSLNSSNSSTFRFLMVRDSNPAINSWTWNNTINISSTNTSPVVAENRTLNFTINASDPENNPINFTWFVNSSEKSSAQNFGFNLINNFTAAGAYTLKLIVADNNSNSVEKEWQVTVTNTNREPVFDEIANREAVEDSIFTFNIIASDPDNDTLTFTSNISSISFAKAANNSMATVNWTPTNDYVGNNTITFTVSDGSKNGSKIMNITVNNTNDAPAITSFSPAENKTIAEFAGIQRFNITFLDVDAGDKTNATWFRNGTLIASNSTNATVTNLTQGIYNIAVVVNDTSLIAGYEWKLIVITGMVSDNLTSPILNLSQSQRENVTNVTINQTAFGGIDFGNNALNFSRVANLEDAVNISKGFVSVDTDAYPELKNKSASLLMKGLNFTKAPLIYKAEGFESTSGAVLCPEDTCTDITYDKTNGALRFRAANFSTYFTQTNTTNGAPTITSTPAATATENSKYSYDVDASDPDGDTLTFSLITKPSGMSISSSTGVISWTPTASQLGLNDVTVNVSDSNLTALQSFQISVGKGPRLVISDIDVKVDGKTDKNVQNNTKIGKDASPGSNVEFKLKIENLFTDEEDLEIEDIGVEITIEDIDDGDDMDKDADEFDLKAEKDEDVKISFDIPLEVEEDVYNVIIDAEGRDENGTLHTMNYQLELEVDKEKHEIRIIKSALTPSTIKCQRQISINAEIINTGSENEDDAALEVASPELGISSLTKGIELDEGTEDNRLAKLVAESISADAASGIYPITINAYYGSTLSDTKTVGLTVEDCELTKEVKKVAREEKPKVEVIMPPAIIEKKPVAEVSFARTERYKVLLSIIIVVFIGTAAFVIGGAYIVLRR